MPSVINETHPLPGDGTAPCPICKDTGTIATITTPHGKFLTHCKCPAGQPTNNPPPLNEHKIS